MNFSLQNETGGIDLKKNKSILLPLSVRLPAWWYKPMRRNSKPHGSFQEFLTEHWFLLMGSLFDTCASLSELLYSSHVMTQSVESCLTFPSKEQEALCGGAGKWILLALLDCFLCKAIVPSGLEHNILNTILAAKPLLPWKVGFL